MEPVACLSQPVSRPQGKESSILKLYGSVIRDIPHLDQVASGENGQSPLRDHVPPPCRDAALLAFAQLAVLRAGARRAMVCLIDGQRQHIVAEATPQLSLRTGSNGSDLSDLWLGRVSFPRSWGICEHVLTSALCGPTADGAAPLIINDLARSQTPAPRAYLGHGVRFYAGFPIMSPSGDIVGVLSVLDDKPRDGLSLADIAYMQDLGMIISQHLDTYALRDQYMRGEKLTRGLISFAEGASTVRPFEDENSGTEATSTTKGLDTVPANASGQPPSPRNTTFSCDGASEVSQAVREPVTAEKSGHESVRIMQESILPSNSRTMFERAAELMRASSDLDGVLILDASVAATGQYRHGEGSEEYEESSNTESDSARLRRSRRKACEALGFATTATSEPHRRSSRAGRPSHPILSEKHLSRLLRSFPKGKIVYPYQEISASLGGNDSESTSSGDATETLASPSKRRATTATSLSALRAMQSALPEAQSIAFVPFWDFERARFFAGCLCWSKSKDRLLSTRVDLAFFKVFGCLIMNEVAKLDALASNQAKTTFVSSISHELRSPLHGILGTLAFIKDTPLDSFQTTMVNSLEACGQTLFDTIGHVLDYSKINESNRGTSSKRLKDVNTVRLSSKLRRTQDFGPRNPKPPVFDLKAAAEEVAEALFAGQFCIDTSASPDDDGIISSLDSTKEPHRMSLVQRKSCYLVLDFAELHDQDYHILAGAWRRILMNVVGNALKYTESGFVKVSLQKQQQDKSDIAHSHIKLTVTDSGPGISSQFLANRAFEPFSQENPHSSGTGLGLCIIRQIIETIGGKVDIRSQLGMGTEVTVKLRLRNPDVPVELSQRAEFQAILPSLHGRRVCILGRKHSDPLDVQNQARVCEGLSYFSSALETTLSKCLNMKVIHTSEWEDNDAELVICPETSFDYLAAIRRKRRLRGKAPATIFIAMDALEAAALRSDVRVTSKESVVEIMTQPCGPHKLAKVVNLCLNRFESHIENTGVPRSATQSPRAQPLEQRDITPPMSVDIAPLEALEDLTINAIPETKSPSQQDESSKIPLSRSVGSECRTSNLTNVETRPEILITDDNPVNRKLLVAFMKKQNIPYQEASNGLEALQALQNSLGRFGVILMDISMPVMDGMTATRAIRNFEKEKDLERTYIIALTGLASASARLEAWSAGIDHFMTKPINFKALRELIQSLGAKRDGVMKEA